MRQTSGWSDIRTRIDRIVAETQVNPFDSDTIANVGDFVGFAARNFQVPEVAKGYWSTICFFWKTEPPLEVEVFGDRFEVYRFYDGQTDIWNEMHSPGDPFPPGLAAILPRSRRD